MPEIFNFQKEEPRRGAYNPCWRAATSALLYMALCSVYIIVSGRFAVSSVTTMQELMAIEAVKGIAFVIITGILYFAISLARWNRIRKQEEMIFVQEKALLLAEKKAMAGMFAATIAHDLNNLLMSLSGLIQGLKTRGKGDSSLLKMSEGLEKGIASLAQLARRVAFTAKQGLPDIDAEVDIQETLQRLAPLIHKHPDLRTTSIDLPVIPKATLRLNSALLDGALLNLLINAGQATGPGGHIAVRLRDNDALLSLEVHDNGPGIPPDQVEAIFDPCYTTKPEGTGVGLLAVKAFAVSCNGEVIVDRSDMGGAVFAIHIPKIREHEVQPLLVSN
jgi:signal transduction histidine kinase